jgi:hypothetical protein
VSLNNRSFRVSQLRTLRLPFALLLCVVLFSSSRADYAPQELIVRLRRPPVRGTLDQVAQSGVATLDNLLATHRAAASAPLAVFAGNFPGVESVVLLRLDATVRMDSLESALSSDPAVEWVTRNHLYRPNSVPPVNDSLFGSEWWLEKISAPSAWQITRGDSAVIIGIIDTGVDYLHPDLQANIWVNWGDNDSNGVDDDHNGFVDDRIGWDFTDAPSLPSSGGDDLVRDNDPMDENGHGTLVAGVVAAVADNGFCMAGVAPHCRIMCLRAGTSRGYLEEDDVAAALLYGAQMGASVINMSFGDVVASPLLREAVQLAHSAGVTLVASAGNDSNAQAHYPSGYSEVISVGASDRFDRRAYFSNYGPAVDLMAPGTEILTTEKGGGCASGLWQGTSFSAPLVSAVAGLVLAVNPNLSTDDIRHILITTADDLRYGFGSAGWDDETTHGRLNARRAVEQARFGADVAVRITSPRSDDGVQADFPVYGEAWGAAFEEYELSFGLGNDPLEWSTVSRGEHRVYGDSLGRIPLPAQDTLLTVRLEVRGAGGLQALDHVRVYVQRTPPRLDSLIVQRWLDGANYSDVVHVRTNQVTRASFLITNSGADSLREDFGYVDTTHVGVLSPFNYPGAWQVRVRLENAAGLVTVSDPFNFEISEPSLSSNLWARTATSLPHGYIGSFTTDYDCDGRPEVWVVPIVAGGFLESLDVFEWNGHDFELARHTDSVYIPQAAGDADEDGLGEIIWRRGKGTIIWEQSAACSFFDHVVYRDTINAVGTAFMDWDSLDGHGEVVIRRYTGPGEFENPRYIIFSVGSDYSLTTRAVIPNETDGDNDLGVPKILIGDLDGDGLMDFLYADRDGDLIFCEREGESVVQKWSVRLPLNDAAAYLTAADLDGDGRLEFVSGCRSSDFAGTESQIRGRHWEYFIFDGVGDDQFAKVDSVFILGAEDVSDHPASVTAADVDADGRAEILISAYPDYYLIARDAASGRYLARWYYSPSESYATLIADWDGNGVNEFFFSDGRVFLRGEAADATGQRPRPPVNLDGEPLGPTAVYLIWSAAATADSYRVYRAAGGGDFLRVAASSDTLIVLPGVPQDVAFTYAVTSLSGAYPNPESVFSNYVELTANLPPSVADTAEFVEPHTVAVRFSEEMGPSVMWQRCYRLEDGRMPDVITTGEGGRLAYVAFDGGLSEGWHLLHLSGLRDAQGSRLPESESPIRFNVSRMTIDAPHVLSHRLLGGPVSDRVEIAFTRPMSATVLDVANYRMESPYGVRSVRALTADRSAVEVSLDPQHPVGAVGFTARLLLRNLTNELGVPMDTAAGRADLLLGGTAASIENAYVFPNPYRGAGARGADGVMFAGLPEQATIRVFTVQGTLVRKIEHRDPSGGTRWDLTNEDGEPVASGVYLFTIHSGEDVVRGKLAVMR